MIRPIQHAVVAQRPRFALALTFALSSVGAAGLLAPGLAQAAPLAPDTQAHQPVIDRIVADISP
ncbi:MAG: hypothetical protein H7234_03605, partial [Herminiimonas sp.]|nr:hypothetical protein [Herminiimonas sp.]